MTIIYANRGDLDTHSMPDLWKDIKVDCLVEIRPETDDYEECINDALSKEQDMLILCGHGTEQGLLHPGYKSSHNFEYLVHEDNVKLIRAKKVFGFFCFAADFAELYKLPGFFSGMFITNEREAKRYNITTKHSDNGDIDVDIHNYELYFINAIHWLLKNQVPLSNWLDYLNKDSINHTNVIGCFNFDKLRYYDSFDHDSFNEAELKEWLHGIWRRDNHPKYQQYFESWFNNTTDSQRQYFWKQKENIENGSLTNWITRR